MKKRETDKHPFTLRTPAVRLPVTGTGTPNSGTTGCRGAPARRTVSGMKPRTTLAEATAGEPEVPSSTMQGA
jgi:hypothetical protein